MIDPSLPLQAGIIARLRAFPALTAIVGQGSYDSVPADATLPYVTLGPPQVLPDKVDCIDAAETLYTIHGWSAGPKAVEIKQLGAAIVAALDDATLTVAGHRLLSCQHEQTDYLDDPDGLTKHVAVTVRVLTEPTD